MAQCDRATMNVDFRTVTARMLQPSEWHRCERFVHFIQVNVRHFHARTLECAVGCEQGLFQHDDGVASGHGQIDDARAGGEAMFFQRLFRHDQNRRSTVANLAGIGGRDRTAFLKQLDAGQAFKGCVIADAFVAIVDDLAFWRIDFDTDDFIGKGATLRRGDSFLVRFQCKLVKVFAGKAIFLHEHFSAHELAEHDAGIGFFETRALIGAHAFFFEQHRRRTHGDARHAFNTGRQHNVLCARHNALRCEHHRLLR